MKNYDRINAPAPSGIERKRAHIVGGGIGGLAAAAFLVSDAQMRPENITIYESTTRVGGGLDASGENSAGYMNPGSRMLERRYECLWYLCAKIPSLQTPGLTVLDETYQANVENPIYARLRLMAREGQLYPFTGAYMSPADAQKMVELLLTPEKDIEDVKVDEWFSTEFFDSYFWYCWGYMFAFRPKHSLIEVKRYIHRFAMYVGALPLMNMVIHTEYNEYDSIINPLQVWLKGQGVRFCSETSVRDIETEDQRHETVATALVFEDATGRHRTALTRDDLVFFTNGSMVQNFRQAGNDAVATFDRATGDLGCFSVWEKLASRDPKFGRPGPFLCNVEESGFYTYNAAITDDSTLFDYMEAKTGVSPLIRNGCTTVVDSNWKLTFFLYGKGYYRNQPGNVDVVHGYGLFPDNVGNFIKKPMRECTSAEIFAELLYHCGLKDKVDDILAHTVVTSTAMPYITSQFMPRKISDRPKVVPEGCVNLAFIGQYVELPGDVVFTVETSVRTAMMAVWKLTGLDKPMIPLYEPLYDSRVLADMLKVSTGGAPLSLETVAQLKDIAIGSPLPQLLEAAFGRLPGPEW